jgi:Icc protein
MSASFYPSEPVETAYFVHISDTHIGPTPGYSLRGHYALPCARRVVEIINGLPQQPDFVIHTGDVVTDQDPASFRLAAETFSLLDVPIYYVNGNHDSAADIARFLPMGAKEEVHTGPDRLTYVFEVKGYRFLVLDAKGPASIDPQGLLPDSQLELVARESQSDGPPLVVFVHFPVVPLNSIWMDNNMLIANGDDLHRALLPARNRLRGVFYGHVHQHMQTIRDGILYFSVASVFSQFGAWPQDITTFYDLNHPPSYAFVHLTPKQTIVHQHTFPRPDSSG